MGEKTGKKTELTGFQLKMLAIISMFIDHLGAVVVERIAYGTYDPDTGSTIQYSSFYGMKITDDLAGSMVYLDMIMRCIGRLAFPLFCFFIVEGFHYTHNRAKYALRLAIFAAISEVPFDLAFNNSFFDMSYNNVMLTLLIGLLAIWGIDTVCRHFRVHKESKGYYAVTDSGSEGVLGFGDDAPEPDTEEFITGKSADQSVSTGSEKFFGLNGVNAAGILLSVVIIIASMVLADFLSTDYGAYGVLAIIIMYMFRHNKMLSFALAVIVLGLTDGVVEFIAILDLIPLYFYHHKQGRKMKWFFYFFYPVHLALLSLFAWCGGLGL